MLIEVDKQITIVEPTQEISNWVRNELIIPNPLWVTLKRLGKDDAIKWKHVPEKMDLFYKKGGAYILPFGCLRPVFKLKNEAEIEPNFNVSKPISIINDTPKNPLFDYQETAVSSMINAKGGVLVAPCGSGKTFMGIEIARRLGKKTLWLCHTGDLLRQAKTDFLSQYPNAKIGLTTEGELNIGEDITISTVQTMVKIDPDYYSDEFEVVIVDECVHCVSTPTNMQMFGKVLSNIPARYKFGLTATPERSDGLIKAMYAYIGCNVDGQFAPTYKVPNDAVKTMTAKHLRVGITSGYDDEKMMELYDASGMINYNNLLTVLTENDERTKKICEMVKLCKEQGRKQIILCNRVDHCERFVEKLNKMEINAKLCVGKVKAKDRDAILNQKVDWDVIVATYALLKEGVSIKELDTLHLATPVKDKGMIVQCAGRIERFLPNKQQPIVYDYVDEDIPYCLGAYTQRARSLRKRF